MNNHTCPRRNEIGQRMEENKDFWGKRDKQRYCNYCGSMHPDDFMQAVREGAEIGPTDKNYKAYVGPSKGRPTGKFYYQHMNEDQKRAFIDLLNAGSINVGYPGHFYRLPFFIQEPGRS